MCRWLAYSGSPILLSALLTQPGHSLIDQSLHARESPAPTNGDGFGVGWYGEGRLPGLFRDTRPAWNCPNLLHVAMHVRSSLFLAHVRAATGTPVQDTNCHPFPFRNWMLQHNGAVPHFDRLKRRLLFDVAPELFPYVQGSTDSEALFFLALTLGMRDDPQAGLERMAGHVERLGRESGHPGPLTLSAAVTDGTRLFALRYSSDGNSPTLYYSSHRHALQAIHEDYDPLPEEAVIVLSEPLDGLQEHWEPVPESSFLSVAGGAVTITPFQPSGE